MRATTPMVAVAWLKSLGITRCGTELPDSANWGGTSWAQIGTHVGGTPNKDTQLRRPVLQVDCWAVDANGKPLWTVADQLGEEILAGTFDARQVLVTTEPGHSGARVHSVVCRSEPRREPGDPDDYARVRLDVQLYWIALPE